MFNYYKIETIPIILRRFKVKNIVITGIPNEDTTNQIFFYCGENNAKFIGIDSKGQNFDFIEDYPLNILPNLNNYEAIFLNDDPNWYTIYNELNLIKENNIEFPLVFICNNIFPHKIRDSYIDPNIIPDEFKNDYSEYLNNNIPIKDGFFHAIEENTPKNGVSTAINDFLKENPTIAELNLKLSNGITILYPQNSISHIRLGKLAEEIDGYQLEIDDMVDNIVENQLLTKYISKFNLIDENINTIEDFKKEYNKKEKIIANYENKIKLQNTELNYVNSQIESYDSKLNLKDSKIKSLESKLINSELKIENLNNNIQNIENNVNSLKNEVNNNKQEIMNKELEYNTRINEANSQITLLKSTITKKEQIGMELNNQLKNANNQINIKQIELTSLQHRYTNQLSKLDNNKYCISCYKEEISCNQLEIEYLKKNTIIKKIFSPLAYIFLIFKSKPQELTLNFKLYKALKNSNCFDIGFYLNNNKDIRESKWNKYFSLELHYICNGFDEKRKFNKKYFNRGSKKELLEYILTCNH